MAALSRRDRAVLNRRGNPLNVRSNQQLLKAHAQTHSAGFQGSMGCGQARAEHGVLVRLMLKRGLNHNSPFKCLL